MRRSEIVRGIRNVQKALNESGLFNYLQKAIRMERSKDSESGREMLAAFRRYSHFVREFGQVETEVARILGLQKLDDPHFWLATISDGASASGVLIELYSRLSSAGEHLEQFAKLIETDAARFLKAEPRAGGTPLKRAILNVVVIEDESHFSTPDRLIAVFRSISYLYEAVSTLQGVSPASLSVVACDSGSDKAFDFLGLASVVQGVKDIILGAWDRVVFHRERKATAWVDLISRSLPVLDQVSDMQTRGALGPEEGELLRRKLVEGVTLFVEAGIVIPEISERSTYNPRQLLAPEPKLLTAASPEDSPPEPPGDGGVEESLTPEERELLKRLTQKAKRSASEDSE